MRRFFILFIVIVSILAQDIMVKAHSNHPNRLINEKSPYLLQHAYNPVDWYPWGEEAFQKAKDENKAIFLSIGYSTCHWCHVMEKESFSNPEIAGLINKYFVPIKVDREERPDIDGIYMNFVVATTGSGGWPLTVFIKPDQKPFYGGTYFPPEDKWGKPGLKTVLPRISDIWKNDKDEVDRIGDFFVDHMNKQLSEIAGKDVLLGKGMLDSAYKNLTQSFDSQNGGFGSAPKFPMADTLSFLLRYWRRTSEGNALKMVETTLSSMRKGGMYDHIGGGFHRYSTDSEWKVPHFEKMLYDQALISKAYLEAYQATGNPEYAQVAREILDYVLRDMAHQAGGFYSAIDADSIDPVTGEKKEGSYYLWKQDDILKILGKEKGEVFSYYFGVEEKGNVFNDPHGEFKGTNILFVSHTIEETANKFKKATSEIKEILKRSKERLFLARSARRRPHLDDKTLVNWNGLMISSLSFASRVLGDDRYRLEAEKATNFILENLVTREGRLLHRYRDGETSITGFIDDYAFFIHGLIDLYEASFKVKYLKEAKRLTDEMLRLFWDEAKGGFFFIASDAKALLVNQKSIYGGAVPSGNAIAAIDLVRLAKITSDENYEEKVDSLFKVFSSDISNAPQGYPEILIAFDFSLGPSIEVVIVGDPNLEETTQMLRAIYKNFIPKKVVVLKPLAKDEIEEITRYMPYAEKMEAIDGKTTVFVCKDYACEKPVNDVESLTLLIK
jgi:hypothetical protein